MYLVILLDNNRNTMPFKKGQSGNPNGRPKGSLSEENKLIREVYKEVINSNLENINSWLLQVAEDNPAMALKIVLKMSDYVLPKLSRVKNSCDYTEATVKEVFG